MTTTPRTTAEELTTDDVSFNARAIAGAWEACEDLPAICAAALLNEFDSAHTVAPEDGEEVDRDVIFRDAGIMVEEKAMGVCAREIAEEHAPVFVELDRDDGKVLALNPAQTFEVVR